MMETLGVVLLVLFTLAALFVVDRLLPPADDEWEPW